MHNRKTLLRQGRDDLAQQRDRVRPFVGPIAVRKVRADVVQARRTEQRVDHRVREHIRVGVAVQTQFRAVKLHAAEDQRPARPEAV